MKRSILEIIGVVVLILTTLFFANKCSDEKKGLGKRLVETDTTEYITKIDSLEKLIEAKAHFVDPTQIDEEDPEVITKYITKTKDCDKPHLTEEGQKLIKVRKYSDTRQVNGMNLSYTASVLGRLQWINLDVNGITYDREINTIRTIKNTYIKQTNQIYIFASYNQTLRVGAMFQNDRFHYGVNYDLGNESVGGQIGYTLFNF